MKKVFNKIIIKKYIYLLSLLFLIYFGYSILIFSPFSYNYFSLIDDGQSYHNAVLINKCLLEFECHDVQGVLIEKDFGRFRPVYWIMNSFLFSLSSFDSNSIHLFRIFIVGFSICLLLVTNIYLVTKSVFGSIVAATFFFTNISFAENIIRIGPTEPLQLIFFGIFSLFLLHFGSISKIFKKKLVFSILIILLILLSLIKETSIVIVSLIFLLFLLERSELSKREWATIFSLPITIILAGKYLAKPETNLTNYSDFYSGSFSIFFSNLKSYANMYLGAIKWYLPIFCLFGVFAVKYRLNSNFIKNIFYWMLSSASFLIILLPWGFSLERYLLPSLFCFAIFIGITTDFVLLKTKEILFFLTKKIKLQRNNAYFSFLIKNQLVFFNFLAVIIFINMYFFNLTLHIVGSKNYASWYSQYIEYESSLVGVIAQLDEKTYLNATKTLDNWEVLYEIPIHLRYLYGQDRVIDVLTEKPKKGDLVISTSSLIQNANFDNFLENKSKEIIKKKYEINQIDILMFRDQFRKKPIQTVLNPPHTDRPTTHYWIISEILE